jgi:hypothetical protein
MVTISVYLVAINQHDYPFFTPFSLPLSAIFFQKEAPYINPQLALM